MYTIYARRINERQTKTTGHNDIHNNDNHIDNTFENNDRELKKMKKTILLLFIFILFIFMPLTNASTLYEYQTTINNRSGWYNKYWYYQTFTIGTVGSNISHYITSVILYVARGGSSPSGNITVSIRATSGGKPTGSDLTSCNVSASSLSTSSSEYEFIFDTPNYKLSAGTQYAIIIRHPTGSYPSNFVYASYATSDTYAGGTSGSTSDSGSTWTIITTQDAYFKEYGYSNTAPTISLKSPLNNSQNQTIKPRCWIWANDSDVGDTLTITWQTNISGSWVTKQVNSSVPRNSDIRWDFIDATKQYHKHYWRVYINDSIINISYTYNFKTMLYYMNTSYNDIIPINDSAHNFYIQANLIKPALMNWLNHTFNKSTKQGYNTETKIYFNKTLLQTTSGINYSISVNILENYTKRIRTDTWYTWSINTTYYNISVNRTYNVKYNTVILNYTYDNTSLTIINNTANVTGKYESYYNATTGWKIYLNYTGTGNISYNGSGLYNLTILLQSLEGMNFTVNWTGDYTGTGTNITVPVNRTMNITGTIEVLGMEIQLEINQLNIIILTGLMMFFIIAGYASKNMKTSACLLIFAGLFTILAMLSTIAYFGGIWYLSSPVFILISMIFFKDAYLNLTS